MDKSVILYFIRMEFVIEVDVTLKNASFKVTWLVAKVYSFIPT